MSQPTITSFFNSRKRPATDDIISSKSKIAHIEHNGTNGLKIPRKCVVTKKSQYCSPPELPKPSFPEESKLELNNLDSTQQQSTVIQATDQSPSANALAKKHNVKNQFPSNSESKTSIISARKELSLGDIRKRLAGSSRLAELKASANRISNGIQQLKETADKKNLKEFRSIDVEVPIR